jgi:hypothetical protein|tara:strand:- start:1022 stop:1387 length:366 start_codon:yes stop_codon:yes gene_type:complete
MELISILYITLIILLIIIAYRFLIRRLSNDRVRLEEFCTLYSTETYEVKGEVEFYFQCPEAIDVHFCIWSNDKIVVELANKEFDSGGHILRYDTRQLENGGYTFGLVTKKQKTIKKFGVKN